MRRTHGTSKKSYIYSLLFIIIIPPACCWIVRGSLHTSSGSRIYEVSSALSLGQWRRLSSRSCFELVKHAIYIVVKGFITCCLVLRRKTYSSRNNKIFMYGRCPQPNTSPPLPPLFRSPTLMDSPFPPSLWPHLYSSIRHQAPSHSHHLPTCSVDGPQLRISIRPSPSTYTPMRRPGRRCQASRRSLL
jgi:hypothetical protein